MCGVEFACKPLQCGGGVVVSCFKQGEDVGVVGEGELAHRAPLMGLENAASYVKGHGFEV
jgi:hypothetical protein